MDDSLVRLELKLDSINSKIDSLQSKIDILTDRSEKIVRVLREVVILVSKLETNQPTQTKIVSTPSVPSSNSDSIVSQDGLIPKNTIDWESFLEATKDTSSFKFLNSIYNNNYPTITLKQYKVIKDLASQINFKL